MFPILSWTRSLPVSPRNGGTVAADPDLLHISPTFLCISALTLEHRYLAPLSLPYYAMTASILPAAPSEQTRGDLLLPFVFNCWSRKQLWRLFRSPPSFLVTFCGFFSRHKIRGRLRYTTNSSSILYRGTNLPFAMQYGVPREKAPHLVIPFHLIGDVAY